MSNLIYSIIFLFIGWNFPQPPWAKWLQNKVITKVRSVFQKAKDDG